MSTLIQPAPIKSVRRQFLKAGNRFDAHSAVFETVGNSLLDRLELLAIQPERVLDLGCRSGYQLARLTQRYPDALIVGVDPAPVQAPRLPKTWPDWLRPKRPSVLTLAGDPHNLPFEDGSFDLVISNLLLPWCHAPHRVFEETSRILASGGAFMFTTAGPDTLMEYRRVWSEIDSHLHGFGLIDMHDLGDTMMASGFAAPVLDRDNVIVDYPDIDALQAELLALGAANLATGRRAGLMAGDVRQRLRDLASNQSRFPVTLELVQGHGWKGELKQTVNSAGEITVSVDSLKGSWNAKVGRRK